MQRLFGTNGVRGLVNESLTPEMALKLGTAIGMYIQSDVVIATDTRTSGTMFKNAVVAGLLSTSCNVWDAGIAPSPALQYYVKHSDAAAGIIITASHNPPEFNGIKVVDADGTELPQHKEEEIERLFFNKKHNLVAWNKIGQLCNADILDFYIDGILSLLDIETVVSHRYKVVIDCGNGAACFTMPYLMSQLADVVTLNAQPDGCFPGRHSEPTPDNIQDLMATVKATGADLGIAYDGDADRAIFVDETGSFVSGDKSLAIIAGDRVDVRGGGIVVTPVSTSQCVEDHVHKLGGSVIYTKVGAPIVARTMIDEHAVFGGEENGGLIFPEHQYCRDGGMAGAAILAIMATKEKSLSELVDEVPSYAIYKTKIQCEKKGIIEKVKQHAHAKRIDETDGIKLFVEDGWVLIRSSGTEPIVRIYVEAKDLRTAKRLANTYQRIITEELKKHC